MQISIFTDELGIDLTQGVSILKEWGLRCVDLRGRVFGKAAEALDAEEMVHLRKLLDDHGMKVTCLESSLAKVHLPAAERVAAEMDKLENIIRAAEALDCRLVRAFFFWQPKGEHADLKGQLNVRPDMLQQVLDLAGPMARRAEEAGLTLAFENCGVEVAENNAVLDALGIGHFGHAWDPANEWLGADEPLSDRQIAERASRTRCVHVKAAGIVPGIHETIVPWNKLLDTLSMTGYRGPVSIETHYFDKDADKIDTSWRVLEELRKAWPGGGAAAPVQGRFDFEPVRFVVVGMGKGKGDARKVRDGEGTALAGVVDVDVERARAAGESLGAEWSTELGPWLERDDVEAVYIVTPTGLHGEIAVEALRAGKHVITTKPMDANLDACDRMITEAQAADRLLAVDFAQRLGSGQQRMKHRLERGDLGEVLAADFWLKIHRTEAYFGASGGWRGTWALDGGGAMSNQCIHHIDELIYYLGVPQRVAMRMWTQRQPIEAEDLAHSTWEYDSGTVVQISATTTFPQDTWYTSLEMHGTAGFASRRSGGPFSAPLEHWFVNGQFEQQLPSAPSSGYDNLAQNLAAAIRTGAPLICDGADGRRSRLVLDRMYESARQDGAWVAIEGAETYGTPAAR